MKRSLNLFETNLPLSAVLEQTDFNEALKLAAQRKGWTMHDLADELEISYKHLWEVTTGRQKMSIKLLKDISEITQVDMLFLAKLYTQKYVD